MFSGGNSHWNMTKTQKKQERKDGMGGHGYCCFLVLTLLQYRLNNHDSGAASDRKDALRKK